MKSYIFFANYFQKIDVASLIKLNFTKNAEDSYHCPVLFKPFTKNSHIVAIRTTGNVYCYEAVEQLNIKGKNWKDLLNDTPFARTDIITIQDPNNLKKFNISTFHHIKNNLRVETEGDILLTYNFKQYPLIDVEINYTIPIHKKLYIIFIF